MPSLESLFELLHPNYNSHEWRHFNLHLFSSDAESACNPFPVLRAFPVHRTDSNELYGHLKMRIDFWDGCHDCAPQSPPRLPQRVLKISGNRVIAAQRSALPGARTLLTRENKDKGEKDNFKDLSQRVDCVGRYSKDFSGGYQDLVHLTVMARVVRVAGRGGKPPRPDGRTRMRGGRHVLDAPMAAEPVDSPT